MTTTTTPKADRYTDVQFAQAVELRNTTDLSWSAIAEQLGVKASYRFSKKTREFAENAGIELRTEKAARTAKTTNGDLEAVLAEARKPYADRIVELEALLRDALAEKRTSGPLKARIRESLGIQK